MKTTFSISVFLLFCIIPCYTHAQWVTISGYVTHAIKGIAIEDASVFEKHSEIGTISNKDGFFKLMLHPGRQHISFSENGYQSFSEDIILKKDTTIVVKLQPLKSVNNHDIREFIFQARVQKERNNKMNR